MDANEQRARFEAWANDYDPLSNPQFHYGAGYIGQVRNRYRPISYADSDLLWQAWQAALAQQVPADGEWVLVPREPTDEMYNAHRMYGDTSDWWNAVIAATPQAPQAVVDAPLSMSMFATRADYEAASQPQQGAVARLHRDGYWTHEAGRDPFDRFGPNANRTSMDVFASTTIGQQAVDDAMVERVTAEAAAAVCGLTDRQKTHWRDYLPDEIAEDLPNYIRAALAAHGKGG